MKVTKMFGGAFASSVDPDKISLTLQGLVPLILAILNLMGVASITKTDLETLIASIVAIISAGCVIWGIIRKFK